MVLDLLVLFTLEQLAPYAPPPFPSIYHYSGSFGVSWSLLPNSPMSFCAGLWYPLV